MAHPSSAAGPLMLVNAVCASRLLPPNDGLLPPNDGLLPPNDGLLPPNGKRSWKRRRIIGINGRKTSAKSREMMIVPTALAAIDTAKDGLVLCRRCGRLSVGAVCVVNEDCAACFYACRLPDADGGDGLFGCLPTAAVCRQLKLLDARAKA